jgi:thiol-disulfide isomerase/thioredoxin
MDESRPSSTFSEQDQKIGIYELTENDFKSKNPKGENNPTVSNNPNFKNKVHLVLFYATWCGWCHRLIPVLKNVMSELHSEGLRLGVVDCDKNNTANICKEVKSYPSLYMIRDKKVLKYEGERNELSIAGKLCELLDDKNQTCSDLPNKFKKYSK